MQVGETEKKMMQNITMLPSRDKQWTAPKTFVVSKTWAYLHWAGPLPPCMKDIYFLLLQITKL